MFTEHQLHTRLCPERLENNRKIDKSPRVHGAYSLVPFTLISDHCLWFVLGIYVSSIFPKPLSILSPLLTLTTGIIF